MSVEDSGLYRKLSKELRIEISSLDRMLLI
jgi:hypothetical protein